MQEVRLGRLLAAFDPWTRDDWRRFFEASHDVCFVCDKPVDDPKYANESRANTPAGKRLRSRK
jgi:hypothetical protein